MEMKEITKVAIIGAGTMGPGIAQVFAQQGLNVWLYDIDKKQIEKARQTLAQNLNLIQKEGFISDVEQKNIQRRIVDSVSLEQAVEDVDLVLEVIPEVMSLKTGLLGKLDQITNDNVILASNTSGLSISEMAKSTQRPDKVIGMHWWNPPFIIPVIEIVKGEKTGEDTANSLLKLCHKIKKIPVLVRKDVPGFLGNRLQYALMREAISLLEEGVASAEDIDTMIKAGIGFKFPVMGPLETIDMAGLDIYYRVSQYLNGSLSNLQGSSPIVEKMVEEGALGLKSKRGFYNYSGQSIEDLTGKRIKKLLLLLRDLGYLN